MDGSDRAIARDARTRRRLICRGAVQGVGFRPTVHRLATEIGLGGWVRNGPEGAVVEVEGEAARVAEFLERFPRELPPLARLESMDVTEVPPEASYSFRVEESEAGRRSGALVPPDASLCADCRREMEDPSDRRHRYPFTTCTNCGPRFSLCVSFPYDRERTSMGCFPFCPDCAREYRDTSHRRFHAEPVCCPACGPRLSLVDADGKVEATGADALEAARGALGRGAIVAVKGLGGFQLACRADRSDSLAVLRERKTRPTKPFAVMARDVDVARRLVAMSPDHERLLRSHRAPILLAPRRLPSTLPGELAPGIDDLGVMLPTTPLHVELYRDAPYDVLVMTSGNAGDEPICRGNREALSRLRRIADWFLVHDRDVVRRVDDSVVRAAPGGAVVMVRRSRGYVPEPVPLADAAPAPVLALGGHLQVTACLASGAQAFPSQHVGDLDTEPARAFLVEVAEGLEEFLEERAGVIAVDAHPDYPSTWVGEGLAARRGARLLRIQHHLAHAASVLAENGAFPSPGERAAAIVLDGTGWGPDGTAWGGEWLLLDGDLVWRRQAHLEELPLVGGERAVREPWRVLAAALAEEGLADALPRLPIAGLVPAERLAEAARLASEPSWPRAAGAGRVFEAAGALLGLAAVNGWEGEAAARLESLASTGGGEPGTWPEVSLRELPKGPLVPGPALLAAAARRAIAGEDPARVASGFHATFCELAAEAAVRVFPRGTRTVALGGGCLVNRLLIAGLSARLTRAGFSVLAPRALPPGDGGLSHGQAVLAALALSRGREPELEGAV